MPAKTSQKSAIVPKKTPNPASQMIGCLLWDDRGLSGCLGRHGVHSVFDAVRPLQFYCHAHVVPLVSMTDRTG